MKYLRNYSSVDLRTFQVLDILFKLMVFLTLVIHSDHLYTMSGKLVSISIQEHAHVSNSQGNSNDVRDDHNGDTGSKADNMDSEDSNSDKGKNKQ